MRIALNIGGGPVGRPTRPDEMVEEVVRAEELGFASAWTVHFSRMVDALTVLGVAASRTSSIDLGVGIVPTYPRHPLALAQQAATVQALAGGRLTLGVGVSHRPVIEGLHGLSYDSPAEHMREYLTALVPLLTEGSTTFRGRYVGVDGGFTVPGTSRVSVLVGALGPRMCRVAGELADGVITWLAGPRSIEQVVQPNLEAGAVGRPRSRVVAAVPVCVCDDVAEGRAQASSVFAGYGALENYQRLYAREGVAGPAELCLVGPEEAVADGLRRFADVGVDELWAVPFAVGGGDTARTEQLLLAMRDAQPG